MKWMIQVILKDFSSLKLSEQLILRRFHFLLPDLLRFQNSFYVCVAALETDIIKEMLIRSTKHDESLLWELASGHFEPRLGIMVGLPSRDKAWSIAHCCQLARGRAMNVEEKHDSEYCQIHVCVTRSSYQIQIFSKSGWDSTTDWAGVHGAIVTGLAISTS
jgi:DNA ligase 4